jgi:hypothetical protein
MIASLSAARPSSHSAAVSGRIVGHEPSLPPLRLDPERSHAFTEMPPEPGLAERLLGLTGGASGRTATLDETVADALGDD